MAQRSRTTTTKLVPWASQVRNDAASALLLPCGHSTRAADADAVNVSSREYTMADDPVDPADESAVALRAKAAHCLSLAEIMGPETSARLVQLANDCLKRAALLEERPHDDCS